MALVFCNLDERPHDITISWDELGISGRWKVRDVWKQTDLGIREKEFSIMVPLHGVVMIKLLKD